MCSIAGAPNSVSQMLKIMEHRHPDGWGVRVLDGFELGMGRLAIVDLEMLPLPFEHEGKVLAFNGEIYNYRELRAELEALGHVFRTRGDTEVLLHAYCEWGEACLDRLNGMFAFAIHDGKGIFLARDIAGEKPLYYTEKIFAFASENKALGFRGVEFPPAHKGYWDGTTLKIEKWWNFEPRKLQGRSEESLLEELEALLEDSVRLRTQADVPYGLFLSDGVDSNLLATFHPFTRTFTYEDGDNGAEFRELLPRIVWHLDAPIDSFSAYPLWKLNEAASQAGVKVVLSGEGADELFGGYVRYVPRALNLKAQKDFPSYRQMFPVDAADPGWADFQGKMRGLLRMGDRMSAAWGIENRCPFLDRRIIEFAFSLPDELRAFGYQTKLILRRILLRRNRDYVSREKHGLFCAVNRWLGEADPLTKGTYLALQNDLWQKFQ